jgi:hypothetical protein
MYVHIGFKTNLPEAMFIGTKYEYVWTSFIVDSLELRLRWESKTSVKFFRSQMTDSCRFWRPVHVFYVLKIKVQRVLGCLQETGSKFNVGGDEKYKTSDDKFLIN